MRVTPTELPEVLLVEPAVHGDRRGYFVEAWNAGRYAQHGIERDWLQDNQSRSAGGVIRGLHYQVVDEQAKLVRALSGRILDVAVDIRIGSPRFGRWVAVELSADNFHQLFVPEGFAHGFAVLSDDAVVGYKVAGRYAPEHECSLRFDDPAIGIDWGLDRAPTLSPKDAAAPSLDALDHAELPAYPGAAACGS